MQQLLDQLKVHNNYTILIYYNQQLIVTCFFFVSSLVTVTCNCLTQGGSPPYIASVKDRCVVGLQGQCT